jgi:hypothetical protein
MLYEVLGQCVAAKIKTVRGTWVEALKIDGLGSPKQTIYSMLGQAVTFGIRAEDDSS